MLAPRQTLWDRFIGVLALQRPTYYAIRSDPVATTQAWWIVLLGGLFSGIGNLVLTNKMIAMALLSARSTTPGFQAFRFFESTGYRIMSVLVSILGGVLGLFVISWLLRLAGRRMSNGATVSVTNLEMRRLVGWCFAPSIVGSVAIVILAGLMPMPVGSTGWTFPITWIVVVIPTFWWLASINFAVQAAFDFSGSRALGAMAWAWLYAMGLFVVIWIVLAIVLVVFSTIIRSTVAASGIVLVTLVLGI